MLFLREKNPPAGGGVFFLAEDAGVTQRTSTISVALLRCG